LSFTMYSTYVTTLSRSRVASAGCVGTRQWSFLPARDAAPSHSRRPCMFVTRACTPVAGDGRSAPAVPLRPPGCTGSRSFFSWTTFTHVHSTVLHEQTGEGRGGSRGPNFNFWRVVADSQSRAELHFRCVRDCLCEAAGRSTVYYSSWRPGAQVSSLLNATAGTGSLRLPNCYCAF
jgi:hypothetical protein